MTPDSDQLKVALELFEQGLQVFPAHHRGKAPLIEWRKFQKQSITEKQIQSWFRSSSPRNFWLLTGERSGWVVLDIDSKAAWDLLIRIMGKQVLLSGAQVATRKGKHFYFRIPEGYGPVQSWSVHDETTGVSVDFRANDTGVIMPPSVHESGFEYRWLVEMEHAAEAPVELLDGTIRGQMPVSSATSDGTTGTGGVTRSLLTTLLSRPPGDEGSGRNDWLARVAGHYAKTYHNQRDLYDAHCAQANQSMGTPLGEKEFTKTVDSIWSGEHRRNERRALDANCGWLQGNGKRLFTQIAIAHQDGTKSYDLEEYANFDLKARGIMISDDDTRTYWLTMFRPNRKNPHGVDQIEVVVPGATFGDDKKLGTWLAGLGCSVLPPSRMSPREGKPGLRLQRYIESQTPPDVRVVKTLGWDGDAPEGGAFVTHEGVIRGGEVQTAEESGVIADPALKKGAAPHFYGFDGRWDEARRVLDEVMSFHDPLVTTVFGSWWAACLLKPQIEARTSLFPFMAIQATSESGKTNGFFAMMTQMNGNTRGEVQPTRAALRDMAAANRNGIVWVDDLDDPAYLMELLRAATSGGSLTKMGEDRESVKNTTIVAPIVISGESLGIENQKALVDRAISGVPVPSPIGRRSRHDPARPQWDDVLELRAQYPQGLSSVAGWYVARALSVVDETLLALKQGRHGVSGRSADKVAVLRAGSRLLDYLLGQDEPSRDGAWEGAGEHAARLEQWIESTTGEDDEQTGLENSLTMEILPWAIRRFGISDKAVAGEHGQPDSPVYFKNYDTNGQDALVVDDRTELWFNTAALAEGWYLFHHGRISQRTASAGALKEQANVLDCPSKRVKIAQSGGRLAYYRKLSGPVVARVIARSQDK